MSPANPVGAALETAPDPVHLAPEADKQAANADDAALSTVTVQQSVRIRQQARKKRRVRVTSTVQTSTKEPSM